jgi:predicted house-cleaning NTP pyrophosphatase (Maf/HAM1 superfamily)
LVATGLDYAGDNLPPACRSVSSPPELKMRRFLLLSAVLVAAASPAHAQKAIKLSDLAGTWSMRTMMGPKDSVVTRSTMIVSADGKVTLKFQNGQSATSRVLSMAGDSVVAQTGPYSSVLRPGQMVTTTTTTHFNGNNATGTMIAAYASGDTLRGKTAGTKNP